MEPIPAWRTIPSIYITKPSLAAKAKPSVHRALFEPAVCLFCPYYRLQCHAEVGHMTHNQRHEQNGKKCLPVLLRPREWAGSSGLVAYVR